MKMIHQMHWDANWSKLCHKSSKNYNSDWIMETIPNLTLPEVFELKHRVLEGGETDFMLWQILGDNDSQSGCQKSTCDTYCRS